MNSGCQYLFRIFRLPHSRSPFFFKPPHSSFPSTTKTRFFPSFHSFPTPPSVAHCNYSNSTSVIPPHTLSTTVSESDQVGESVTIPDPPTNCCMSGCANCVWITYAQELVAIYKDGGRAAEKVMKAIDDPSLKIFISLELKELLEDSESNI